MDARKLMQGNLVACPKEHEGLAVVCGAGFFSADLMFRDGTSADGVPENDIEPVELTGAWMVRFGFSRRDGLFRDRWTLRGRDGRRAVLTFDKFRGGFRTSLLGGTVEVRSVDMLQRMLREAGGFPEPVLWGGNVKEDGPCL